MNKTKRKSNVGRSRKRTQQFFGVAADVLFFMQILLHMRNCQCVEWGRRLQRRATKSSYSMWRTKCAKTLIKDYEGANHKFVEQGATCLFKQSNTQRRCRSNKIISAATKNPARWGIRRAFREACILKVKSVELLQGVCKQAAARAGWAGILLPCCMQHENVRWQECDNMWKVVSNPVVARSPPISSN